MSASGEFNQLRLFLEGIECSIESANVTFGKSLSASISVIASEKVLSLLPGTLVEVYFYDKRAASSVGETEPYSLLFIGELTSVVFSSTFASKTATLSCVSSYENVLSKIYAYVARSARVEDIARIRKTFTGSRTFLQIFVDGQTENFFEDALKNPRVTQPGLTTLQGPAAAIVSLIEKSVGTDERGGSGDFVAAVAAKTKLTQQLASADSSEFLAKLIRKEAIQSLLYQQSASLAGSIKMLDIIAMFLRQIYTMPAFQACPKFETRAEQAYAAPAVSVGMPVFNSVQAQEEFVNNREISQLSPTLRQDLERMDSARRALVLAAIQTAATAQEQEENLLINSDLFNKISANLQTSTETSEIERLFTTTLVPDLFFGIAPRCNVLYTNHVGSIQYSVDIANRPTRLMLTTDEITGGEGRADNLIVRNYFAPPVEMFKALQGRQVTTQNSASEALLLLHERHTGIVPEYRTGRKLTDRLNTAGLDKDAQEELFLKLASYYFVQARFQPSSISATGIFNPYVAAGFPVALMDPHDSEVYYTGQLLSVTHNVSQSDATTSYNVGFARKTDEIDEILTGTSLAVGKSYKMEERPASFSSDVPVSTNEEFVVTSTGALRVNALPQNLYSEIQSTEVGASVIHKVVVLSTASESVQSDNKFSGIQSESINPSEIESVGVYVEEDRITTPMAEELARPTWFSDDYSVKHVGERIYQKLLGTGSILDNLPDSLPRNAIITVDNAQESFIQTADALAYFRGQYENASQRGGAFSEAFVKNSTYRPIASIADVRRMFSDLGSRVNRVSTNERCLPGTAVSEESEQTRQNRLDPSTLHEEKAAAVSLYKDSVKWRAKR